MDEFALAAGNGTTRERRKLGVAGAIALAAWLGAAGVALAALTDFSSRPGVAARAPTSWPAASHLDRAAGRGTLVMIAHTKCACTRASLRELERLMARAGERLEAFVIFAGPREASGVAGILDLRSTARAIPGVRVIEDEDEARVFGAATSGQVLLYDQGGALVFRGGITPSRGHEGESLGGEAVRRFALGADRTDDPTQTSASEVFGCALFDTKQQDSGAQATGAPKGQ